MYVATTAAKCVQPAYERNLALDARVARLTTEAGRAQDAFDVIADRPDLDSRGAPLPGTDSLRAGVRPEIDGRLRRPRSCPQPERAQEILLHPPGPISTALPEVSLEAMNACQALEAGWLTEDQVPAALRRECAVAGYLGVSPPAPNIEQGGIAETDSPYLETPAALQPSEADDQAWRNLGLVAIGFAALSLFSGSRR